MTRVVRTFSNAAATYDTYSSLQRTIATRLAAQCDVRPGQIVCDVGTGTGLLLDLLRTREIAATYIGIDAALEMLARGSGIRVQADLMQLPFQDGKVARVFSASCYQWAPDIRRAFAEAHRVLADGGRFQAALFTAQTLKELRTALGVASPLLVERFRYLPSVEDVGSALAAAGFCCFDYETETCRQAFAALRDAWRWLQRVGANGTEKPMFIGRQALAAAEAQYAAAGNGQMTFEIVYINAQK